MAIFNSGQANSAGSSSQKYLVPGDWLINPIDERIAEKMASAHGLDTQAYTDIIDGRFLDEKSKEIIHRVIGSILVRFKLMCVDDDLYEDLWSTDQDRVAKILGWITTRTGLPELVLRASRLALGKNGDIFTQKILHFLH